MASTFIERIGGAGITINTNQEVIDLSHDLDGDDQQVVDGSIRSALQSHAKNVIKCAGVKRMNRDILDGRPNERAKKAEHDRAVACKEMALLIVKHAKEIAAFEKQLATAKQKIKETEAAMEKLMETDDENKCPAAAKLMIKELKAKIAEMKQESEAAEAKRENDSEYAELKNALKSAKWRHGYDEELQTKAYTQISQLKRDLESAKKQSLKEAKTEKEKDTEYAELKKELKNAKWRIDFDGRMLTDAYGQICKLKRDLASAKAKLGEDMDDDDEASSKKKGHLKGCSSELISKIESDIIDKSSVTMDDIAGLEYAKKCVNELIVWPMSRPDIFTGLRALPRGLLLFGPPGTGKTMIGKAIANQSGATFFYISASSIGSKWAGESEQLVRTLFTVAAAKQPSVIFIDEIDSMLTKRSDDESGFRRAIKTEFMVQLDGMSSNANDSVLIIGATNCPHTLDEAIRRRFVKRMYIPLPATEVRAEFMKHALKDSSHDLALDDFKRVADSTEGFSCADMHALCTEAALAPVREISDVRNVKAADIRPIQHQDFVLALANVKSSVGVKDLKLFEDWNAEFGS